MTLRPLKQGTLDCLCGVYAVINATRLAAWPADRLTDAACRDLFTALAVSLNSDGRLLATLTAGSFYPALSGLLRTAGRWLDAEFDLQLRYRRPYHCRPVAAEIEVRRQLAQHLAGPQTSAIVCVTEPETDHWSVACAVSRSRSVGLFDSRRHRAAQLPPAGHRTTASGPKLVDRDLYLIWTRS